MPFGVRDGGPGGDVPDGAGRRAPDVDGPGAALGGHQQVADPDPAGSAPPRAAARWRCRPGAGYGPRSGRPGSGGRSRRHEPGGLHADIAAGRQARPRQGDDQAGRVHGVDPAAAPHPARSGRRRSGRTSSARRRSRPPWGAPARPSDTWPSQPMPYTVVRPRNPATISSGPEPPGAVERDPGRGPPRRQAGEPPRPTLRADHDDPRIRPRLDGEGRIFAERAWFPRTP